jgi:hypothetical protein
VADLNALDCKLYVETSATIEDLSGLVGRALCGSVETLGRTKTIRTSGGEIEIRANEDRQPARAGDFPDGFLFFRYVFEYYAHADTVRADRIKLIASLLDLLWQHGWPAVAACDYEDDLPHKGGYKDRTLPWPSTDSRSPTAGVLNAISQPGTIPP